MVTRYLLAVLAIVIAVAGGAEGATPSFAIHVVRADGTGDRVLGARGAVAFALAPDGLSLAFLRAEGDRIGVWRMNSDGSGERRLVLDDAERPILPRERLGWAQDGTAISFTVFDRPKCEVPRGGPLCGFTSAVLMDAGDGRRLLTASGEDLQRSRDGARTIWACDLDPDPYGDREALCFTMRKGGAVTKITRFGVHRPQLSPDGWYVAYTGSGGEYLAVSGLRRRASRLLYDSSRGGAVDGPLSWSPDGSRIVFSTANELLVVPAAGGRPRPIALNAGLPAWSPSGKAIAFVGGGLRTIRPDGTRVRIVSRQPLMVCDVDSFTAPSCTPAWSPDSRLLYYLGSA
jgi:Tol biopolymer transport system component